MSHLAVASLRRPLDSAFLPECLINVEPAKQWAAYLVTALRIPLAIVGVTWVLAGQAALAMAAFLAFAILDVFDGIAARSVGGDTANRRIADVIVDRLAIHAAFLAACLVMGGAWLLWTILLLRDVAQGCYSLRFVRRTGTVVIGAYWHMSYGVMMLLTVGFLVISQGIPTALAIAACAVSIATCLDYLRGSQRIEERLTK